MHKQLIKKTINDPVIIGKIGSVYGILGWVKIFSFTEKLENIFYYQPWFIKIKDKWHILKVSNWKYHNKYIITKLKNIDNRNTADKLTNHDIIVDYTQLPPLKNGDYYLKDLIGCKVINMGGYDIGTIIDFIENKANYIIVIKKKQIANAIKKSF
ncbi:ribosome maturation factor RimM [Candidatus Pantoea edessiphila]|uniref:ribosome maturation factor RimM n=1 Tax=Candidatus Pantoea edessiphila TaxID=2044610 RepID=UPI001F54731C|nr:ribosome maturation factor RimM [Candidatus Pantoea edessiphila]